MKPAVAAHSGARGPGGRGTVGPLLAVLGSSWVLGGPVLLASWQPIPTTPAVGLDPSWVLALQMAAVDRLHWGSEFIFSYGPLGFLRAPLVAYAWPSVLGGLYLLMVRFTLAVSVVWIARRRFNLAIAVAIAFVTVSLSGSDASVLLAFVWCSVAIAGDPPTFPRQLVLFGGGALTALELLGKLDDGLLIAGMCAVAAATMGGRRSRNLLSFTLTSLASLLGLWFAAGQGVANVGDFVVGSADVLRGYAAAMGTPGPAGWPVAALVVWGLAASATLYAGRELSASRRIGLVLLVLGLGFVAWKEGFVRQAPDHMAIFFAWMLVPWIALRRERYPWALVGFGVVVFLYFAAIGLRPVDRLQPVENARTMVSDLRTVFDPARRKSARAQALADMRLAYGLNPRTLALLQGKTVDVWPWEAGLVWAYGLRWKPLPTFQNYSAYTRWLDERNADTLASSDGPQRILRHGTNPLVIEGLPSLAAVTPYSVDGRYAAYDSPAASLAMLCHFDALQTTRRYQVLGRVRNRCGRLRPLSSLSVSYGQNVRIPKPPGAHDIVFVRVYGGAPSGVETVRTLLYRSAARYVVFNGKLTYRVVPSVLGDGLILDSPPGSDLPRRFSLAPDARTVGFLKDSAWLSPDRRLRLDFFAMRVAPAPCGGPGSCRRR